MWWNGRIGVSPRRVYDDFVDQSDINNPVLSRKSSCLTEDLKVADHVFASGVFTFPQANLGKVANVAAKTPHLLPPIEVRSLVHLLYENFKL
jgi:hypothetical protein